MDAYKCHDKLLHAGMLKLFDICKVAKKGADGTTTIVLAENTDGIRKKLRSQYGQSHSGTCCSCMSAEAYPTVLLPIAHSRPTPTPIAHANANRQSSLPIGHRPLPVLPTQPISTAHDQPACPVPMPTAHAQLRPSPMHSMLVAARSMT